MKKILLILTLLALAIPNIVSAQYNLVQGGTGWKTSTLGDLLVGTSSTLRYSRLPIGTAGYILQSSSTSPYRMSWVATSTLGLGGGGSGTVTSVAQTVPTGFTITGSPITTSGTLAIAYDTGYEGLKTASSTQWNAAYASTTALTPAYLRGLFSNTATGLTYNSSTGATTLTANYIIPLSASTTQWATAYGSTTALTPAYIRGLFSGSSPITFNSGTGAIGFDFSTNNTWTGGNTFGNASSTNLFATSSRAINSTSTNKTVTGILYLPALSNGCLEASSGIVTSTGSNCGTGGGGITSLNGQTGSSQTFASTTTGGQFNISSAGNVHTFNFPASPIFTNASTTAGLTVAGVLYLPALSDGCAQLASGILTSTGVACGSGSGGSNWTVGSNFLRTSTTTDYVLASYYVASSTTGTSTFAGKVAIGTTTLPSTYKMNVVGGASRFGSGTIYADLGNSLSAAEFTGFGRTASLGGLSGAIVGSDVSTGYTSSLGTGSYGLLVTGPTQITGATQITGSTTNSGNLLIGTTTPTNKLFVQGAGGANPFVVASSTGSTMLSLSQAGVLNISALTDGCLQASSGNVTSTGSACGSGGGGSNWTVISGGLRTSTTTDFARAAYFVATSTTATSTFAGGVGIGTISPAASLHINTLSGSSNRESLLKGSVSDSGNDAFYITNFTSVNGSFVPTFGGYVSSVNTRPSMSFVGLVSSADDASDSANYGIIDFRAERTTSATDPFNGSLSSIQNRKLFTFSGGPGDSTSSDLKMTILANGNVGIGSSTPLSKLIVSGSIIVPEVTVATSTAMLLDIASSSSNVSNNYLLRIGTSAMTINFATSSLIAGAKTDVTVCNPAGGTAGTITWDSRVSWPGGFAPGQTTTANNCDIWTFKVTNGTSSLRLFGNVSSGY